MVLDTVQTYILGYGAGDGEEYSTIPGYEGQSGAIRLMDLLVDLPEVFKHPDTGDVYVAVEWLGSECDNGYRFVLREKPLGMLKVA